MMKKGFTLIELVITVAIIGILAAIAIPLYSGYIKQTKIVACNESISRIKQAYNSDKALHNEEELTGDDLLDDFTKYLTGDPYNYYDVPGKTNIYQADPQSDSAYVSVDNKLETSCFVDGVATASTTYASTQIALEGFNKVLETMGSGQGGKDLIAGYVKNEEKFQQVDQQLIEKANLLINGKYDLPENLQWKANTAWAMRNSGLEKISDDTEDKYLLFATEKDSNDWKGSLAYYDGTYYYSNNSSVDINKIAQSEIATWLTTNGWTAIE